MTAVVACFVSPHGFGHAARACAVLEALAELRPDLRAELFTTVPEWFFADSLRFPFRVHPLACDIGLAQRDALREDLAESARRLAELYPLDRGRVAALASDLRDLEVDLVLADIAPLGLAAAARAGLPSLLVESFTWDWIYRPYAGEWPAMGRYADLVEPLFALAERRIRCTPFCGEPRGLVVPPVSRRSRRKRAEVRTALGVPEEDALVLVTMGGIEWSWSDELASAGGAGGRPVWLVAPGGVDRPSRTDKVIRLPHRSGFYHPDLVHAADGVIGKLGYSTVAEVWAAGVPYAFVRRPGFPESAVLEAWCVEGGAAPVGGDGGGLSAATLADAALSLAAAARRTPGESGAGEVAAGLAEMLPR